MTKHLTEITIPSDSDLSADERPRSALEGLTMTAIDTDPASNLVLLLNGFLNGLPQQQRSLIAVVPMLFHGTTPGYLVISADPFNMGGK